MADGEFVGGVESTSLQSSSNSSAERKAAAYYAACLNANKTMDHLGSKPLIELLSDVFASRSRVATSWSAATEFNESTWSFQSTLERTHSLGLPTFFNVWVSQDDKQPTQNILQVITVVNYVIHRNI